MADVQRIVGYASFELAVREIEGHKITKYRVERRMVLDVEPPGMGWRLLDTTAKAGFFDDFDVMPNQLYQYKVTPYALNLETLVVTALAPGYIRYVTRPQTFFSGHGLDGTAILDVRSEALTDWEDQAVTITRYDNMELSGPGTPIVTREDLVGPHVRYKDRPDPPGLYVYAMELLFVEEDDTYTSTGFTISPIVVQTTSALPTQPSLPVVEESANEIVTVSWTVPEDNKQAAAYEVQRRNVHPGEDPRIWSSRGTTVAHTDNNQYSMTLRPNDADTTYGQYRVVPITLRPDRAGDTMSDTTTFPQIPQARCWDHLGNETDLAVLYIYPDIMGYGIVAPDIPFLFDLYGLNEEGSVCIRMEAEDFHMQRAMYHKTVVDDAQCPVAGEACAVLNLQPDENGHYRGAVIEDLDIDGVQWGFPHYRLLTFHDKSLVDGRFGTLYRVCGTGLTATCSNWMNSGIHPVGEEPNERNYPEIVSVY